MNPQPGDFVLFEINAAHSHDGVNYPPQLAEILQFDDDDSDCPIKAAQVIGRYVKPQMAWLKLSEIISISMPHAITREMLKEIQ